MIYLVIGMYVAGVLYSYSSLWLLVYLAIVSLVLLVTGPTNEIPDLSWIDDGTDEAGISSYYIPFETLSSITRN